MIELHVGTGVAEMKTNQSGIYMYGELKKKVAENMQLSLYYMKRKESCSIKWTLLYKT